MKPIVYQEKLSGVYREYQFLPLNKRVEKARSWRLKTYLENAFVNFIYYIFTRKSFVFWGKMIGLMRFGKYDDE